MRALSFILALAAGSFLFGCAVGPNYQKPQVSVEKEFAAGPGNITSNSPVELWWKSFHDPELEKLIAAAAGENLNLKIALLRVRTARLQRRVNASYLFPNVDADGGYVHAYGSKNVKLPLGGSAGGDPPGADPNDSSFDNQLSPLGKGGLPGALTDLYQLGFDATWEIDIFGGTRRRIEASTYQLQAATESSRNVMVSLFAEVARDYLELRGTQARLEVARQNLKDEQEILDLVRSERKSGLANELEVTQAAAQAAITSATIPPLEAAGRRLVHALSILLSRQPDALVAELENARPVPVSPPEIPVGLPSELLKRRPDIRVAERQIAAATANIGVAKADLFPKFTLTAGNMGVDSTSIDELFNWDSRYFLVSPTVTWRIFDAGRIMANIKLQRVGRESAVLQYRSTILTALQEVEDALVQYASDEQRHIDLVEALNQSRQSLTLARQQYEHGLRPFLAVLDAERTVLNAEDMLAQSDQIIATDLVAVYKSLGGGWQTGTPGMAGKEQF